MPTQQRADNPCDMRGSRCLEIPLMGMYQLATGRWKEYKKLKRFRNEGEGDETDKKEAAEEDEA